MQKPPPFCNPSRRPLSTNLITIPPTKRLRPNILIRILNPLFQRRHMLPVLPVLVPEVFGVERGEDQGGDYDAGEYCQFRWE